MACSSSLQLSIVAYSDSHAKTCHENLLYPLFHQYLPTNLEHSNKPIRHHDHLNIIPTHDDDFQLWYLKQTISNGWNCTQFTLSKWPMSRLTTLPVCAFKQRTLKSSFGYTTMGWDGPLLREDTANCALYNFRFTISSESVTYPFYIPFKPWFCSRNLPNKLYSHSCSIFEHVDHGLHWTRIVRYP